MQSKAYESWFAYINNKTNFKKSVKGQISSYSTSEQFQKAERWC